MGIFMFVTSVYFTLLGITLGALFARYGQEGTRSREYRWYVPIEEKDPGHRDGLVPVPVFEPLAYDTFDFDALFDDED